MLTPPPEAIALKTAIAKTALATNWVFLITLGNLKMCGVIRSRDVHWPGSRDETASFLKEADLFT